MAILNKKLIMMGVSTILIPLGKAIFNKIVNKGVDKLDSGANDEEKDTPMDTAQKKKSQ